MFCVFPICGFSERKEKVNRQGKLLVLLGDFNLNLLDNTNNHVTEFIDTLSNYLMLPHINLPTRISKSSQTLIDNIFISPNSFDSVSGNFISGISDHLPQFVILNYSSKNTNVEGKTYKDWKKFNATDFKTEFQAFDWNAHLKLDDKDPSLSFDLFFNKLIELVDRYNSHRKIDQKANPTQ